MNTIYCPSFEAEKTTRAFNRHIWWFVSLISLFTVGIGVFAAFHPFMSSFLGLVSSPVTDHMAVPILACTFIFAALAYQLVMFLTELMTSYSFENNRIVKGKIQNKIPPSAASLINDAAVTAYMLKNAGDSGRVMTAQAGKNLGNILQLIEYNMNPAFVSQCFDTDIYKKKVYTNPVFVKETRYTLVYNCENGKLVIPKIYAGLCSSDSEPRSFILRIVIRSIIVFAIGLMIACADLGYGSSQNKENLSNIADTRDTIGRELGGYNYAVDKVNSKVYKFSKSDGIKKSEITYYFDKNGAVEDVDIQLYYNDTAFENELWYIISSMDESFNEDEVDDFISQAVENVNSEHPDYTILRSENEKYSLRLGSSEGYVDIH